MTINDAELRAACAAAEHDLAELALGSLDGRDRAVAMAHVEGCARCTAELDRLSAAADALLHLAAEAEPPVGFEVRLFERLGVRDRGLLAPAGPVARRPGRPAGRRAAVRRRFLGVAAVAVALGLGFLGGSLAAPGPTYPNASSGRVATAALVGRGRTLGQVATYTGHPAWIVMTIEHAGQSGAVTCQVVTADGEVYTVGHFHLSRGYGAWDARLPVPTAQVASARLVAPGGRVLASGRLVST